MSDSATGMYAFWSEQAATRSDCAINRAELDDGRIVEYTAICKDIEAKEYLWPDKQWLGRVRRWVSNVRMSKRLARD